jgi:tRNA nucleotidyltransferase (CCA-adding enzyme)
MNYKNKYLKYKIKFEQMAGTSKLFSAIPDELISKIKNISKDPKFIEIINPNIKYLDSIFKRYRYDLRIVGGAVRDIMSKNEVNDIDFSTTATPAQMMELFKLEKITFYESGIEYGTLTVIIDNEEYEITTLRKDIETNGRHAITEYILDWKEDANRRDLTINAMNLDLNGNIGDYFNGLEDLEKKNIKFVGVSNERIKEDYLRILRYFRFHSRYGNDKYEPDIIKSIIELGSGLSRISRERVNIELNKLVKTKNAVRELIKISELDLNTYLDLPNRLNIEEFARLKYFSKNSLHLIVGLIPENVKDILTILKFNNKDVLIGDFIEKNREKELNFLKIEKIINLKSKGDQEKFRDLFINLLEYNGDIELSSLIKKMIIKHLPIDGKYLKEKGLTGRELGLKLKEIHEYWADNNYSIISEEIDAIIKTK